MRRLVLLGVIMGALLGLSSSSSAAPFNGWGTLVIANYSCDYHRVTATLTWSGNSPYAAGQYVQMSYTDDGWQPQTTTTVGPYHPSVNRMAWDGLAPGTRHFLRFTQQHSNGAWDSSYTFRFDTPWCGADGYTPTFLSFIPEGMAFRIPTSSAASASGGASGEPDCANGTGDNPIVEGPVDTSGGDPNRLDGDGDGIGCER